VPLHALNDEDSSVQLSFEFFGQPSSPSFSNGERARVEKKYNKILLLFTT
jgi:hypothetical protein